MQCPLVIWNQVTLETNTFVTSSVWNRLSRVKFTKYLPPRLKSILKSSIHKNYFRRLNTRYWCSMQQKGANESYFTVFQSCLNIKWLKFLVELFCVNMRGRVQVIQATKQKMSRKGKSVIWVQCSVSSEMNDFKGSQLWQHCLMAMFYS